MTESFPPPAVEDDGPEPGWYPDPQAKGILRWWDRDGWSEDDVRPVGETGYPAWHPEAVRERIRAAVDELIVRVSARFWQGG